MEMVLQKPLMGSPCNSCGYCCIAEQCQLSVDVLGPAPGPCKALEKDGDKLVCGLVRRPAFYMFGQDDIPESKTAWLSCLFAGALGFGMGCDATDEDDHK